MQSLQEIQRFMKDVAKLFEDSDKKIMTLWCDVSELDTLKRFDKIDFHEALMPFEFIKSIKGSYLNIDKLQFILSALKYIPSDIQQFSELLDYKGFESLIQTILIKNGYHATKNYRFSDNSLLKNQTKQKKYEIDVIGLNRNFLLVIDAKQWKRKDSFSKMNEAADHQYQRALALKENPEAFSKLMHSFTKTNSRIKKYLPYVLIPLMVTFEDNKYKYNNKQIPLVPISKFNAFLQEFQQHLHYFATIEIHKVSIQKQLF